MEPQPVDVLPLLAPELLAATVSSKCERLGSNAAWDAVFGRGDLWERLEPEDGRFAAEYVAEAAAGSMVTHQVFLIVHHHQDLPAPVLLNFLPVRLPDAEPGMLPVVITGEVLQEPKRWAADQTKRRRMEMLGQMAMGIAHDFNNLLTSILGHAELLKGSLAGFPDIPYSMADQLETIERAGMDGAELVRKIQRYIRHEKQDRFEPLDLASIVDEVTSLTRPYWYNEPRREGIEITLDQELDDVPPIRGVEAELREVFVNLILNAVQAMPDGGTITLRTRLDGHTAIAEVEDTGMGISEDARRRIFEPLFTTKGEDGTGMGLTVSHGIVQEHDGSIEVQSTLGEGTHFILRFPIVEPDERPKAPVEEGDTLPPTAPETPFRAGRILVVDDEQMVRSVTAKLLRLKGYTVKEADGGPRALELLAEHPFDLIVTDLGMPEMSGSELAYRIRTKHPDIPILLLTGHTDADDQSEHVDAVVKKPFQVDALDEKIQRLLAR